jgi:hypothetical protein
VRVGEGETVRHLCVCSCSRARAARVTCVRHLRHLHSLTHSVTFVFVCAFHLVDDSLYSRHLPVCVHLAVLGTVVGGGLASSAHEWLLQRLAAVIASVALLLSNSAAESFVLGIWCLQALKHLMNTQSYSGHSGWGPEWRVMFALLHDSYAGQPHHWSYQSHAVGCRVPPPLPSAVAALLLPH